MTKSILRNINGTVYILTCSKKATALIAGKHMTTRWSIKKFGSSVGVSLIGASAARKYLSC
tara:strand:- start:872 stop:1054 length:183 start_codon:yes stop_codon:yes gene_type:complete